MSGDLQTVGVTITEAQEKKYMQFIRLSFEAAVSGQSTDTKAERPLCLYAIIVGIMFLTHTFEMARVDMLCNEQPKFVSSLIAWGFHHRSDDEVRTAPQSLLPCLCNLSDHIIAQLHAQNVIPKIRYETHSTTPV